MVKSLHMGDLYDEYYFRHSCGRPYQRDEGWLRFFDTIAGRIVSGIRPATVLDAGCAMGFLVEALRQREVKAFGVDISEYAIQNVHPDVQPYCWVGSVTDPFPQRYDLIVCVEVLEHLSPHDAERAVENFCQHTDDVLFSSTPLDYKEATHLNVQPPEYWAELFARHGFFRDGDFDASFITPWAARFRKTREPVARVIAAYERHLWRLEQEGCALRELVIEHHNELAEREQTLEELRQKEKELRQKEEEISRLDKRLQEEVVKAQTLEEWVHKISHGVGWRLLQRFYYVREHIIAPPGTRRGKFYDLLKRAAVVYADGGLAAVFKKTRKRLESATTLDPYQLWLAQHALTPERIRQLQEEIQTLAYQPKISIVMPVYNTEEIWLRQAIESVRSQIYPHWELCICDDGSTAGHISRVITEYSQQDERIHILMSPQNRGISAASNRALSLATGEFVGFLDHDDELTPDALCEVVKFLNEKLDLDFIYTDEDKLTVDGRREEPFFKPDWSPDLLLSMNYIAHFAVVRRSMLQEIGGFTEGLEGSQDYDLFLRLSEKTQRIGHVAKPLYSWRKIPNSTASDTQAKPYAYVAGRQALQEHLRRQRIAGEVVDGLVTPFRYRVRYQITGQPLVSIIIPIRDRVELLKRCLESLEEKTTYRHFEIIIVDNQSEKPETLAYLVRLPHTVVPLPGPFNYSQLNNVGAAHARGEFLLFLNNDTEVIADGWLNAMLEHAQRPQVGAVGAKLFYPNRTIQHAGVVLGHGGVAGHAFWHLPEGSVGYFDFPQITRNCSAVTAACMMMRKSVFAEVEGFDENIKVAFNDIDLCLRVREKGYVIIYTPYAVLYHLESATRKKLHPMSDEEYVRKRWRRVIQAGDPYYNPHLSLERFDFSLRILDQSERGE